MALPASLQSVGAGYFSGACYEHSQAGTSLKFQSCGSDNSFTVAVYGDTNDCTGDLTVSSTPFSSGCTVKDGSFLQSQCLTAQSSTSSPAPSSSSSSGCSSCFAGTELVTHADDGGSCDECLE